MSLPWRDSWQDVVFGYMHEDTAIEARLLPAGGSALCVLSGGDTAYALSKRAAHVTAADVNPAQLHLHELKLACLNGGITCAAAADMRVEDAIARSEIKAQLSPPAQAFWENQRRIRRPLLSPGIIDARLRFLASWIVPLVVPISVTGAIRQPSSTTQSSPLTFTGMRWRLAWSLLSFGIMAVFPKALRRHLPTDVVHRLRRRFESACQAPASLTHPLLCRMFARQPSDDVDAFKTSWPVGQSSNIHAVSAPLDECQPSSDRRYDLVSASNILDASPTSDWPVLLTKLTPSLRPGAVVILRSLFREPSEWPAPPNEWCIDHSCIAEDKAPLCRVTQIVRYRPITPAHNP